MCVLQSGSEIYERTIIFTITHTRTQIQTHALRTQQTEWWENIPKGYQSAREWAGERAKAQDPEENCPDCYTTFPCPFSTFALTKTEHSLNHIIMHTERASKQQLNGCRVLCPQYIVFVLVFAITLNLLKILLTFNGLFCWQSIRNNYLLLFESFSPKNFLDIIPKQMKTNRMSHWMLLLYFYVAYSFMNEWLYISYVLMCMQIITKCHYYIAEYQQISVYGFM